jgi:hypothetical protein
MGANSQDIIETNADDVEHWFWKEARQLEDDARQMIEDATNETYEKAIKDVPVDTGALRDDITKEVEGMRGTVYNLLHYAPHVGVGTVFMEGRDYLYRNGRDAIVSAMKSL